MPVVTWQDKIGSTVGYTPVTKGGSAGVYWEDYNLPDGYWRYSWTNFTLDANPTHVEVNRMEYE